MTVAEASPVVGTVVPVNKWEYALLDCCATGGSAFLASLLCAPCMLGSIQGRLEGSTDEMDSVLCTDVIAATLLGSIVGPVFACVACWCSFASFTFWQRYRVRLQYNIQGDFVGDCLTAYCCTPCTATLSYTQISYEKHRVPQIGYAVPVCMTRSD
eukprot:TRINITY_DN317_c3_g2_i1.p1 TRINITY_DN317_c3_g2~~TRINITY_DN317_c3_g2_i1.p1  ORF type:complete len:173 (+),score=30.00 TRINITY_DN317_c3_g2_i1:54-521(+)